LTGWRAFTLRIQVTRFFARSFWTLSNMPKRGGTGMTDVTSSATVQTQAISARGFSVFDPALPLLAAKAALQLDKLRIDPGNAQTSEARVDAVEKLQHLLQGTADSTQQGTQRALVDPLSARVL